MFPQSSLGRFVVVLWIALSLGLLIFACVQLDVHDMPIALTWLLLALNFPSSILSALLVAAISSALPAIGFTSTLLLWMIFTMVGYLQWFVLLPWIWRKLPSGLAHMRLLILVAVFIGSSLWGLGDISDGTNATFYLRISICLGTVSLLLWWATRPGTQSNRVHKKTA